ncbi:hypothetical protein BDZ45DRAFT_110758 [Acephala macrosclerotiorum]|nr:hypothetical protein BDZ45DRAFT_110758 [Acephala macrosclerotiorum]
MTHASFSNLPPEIRQEIWRLSFEPRVLCLHIHARELDYNSRKNLAVSFTCTVLDSRSGQTPDDIFAERSEATPQVPKDTREINSKSLGPTSLGPVHLYICWESRAVALRRYELAFTEAEDLEQGKQRLRSRQDVALKDWDSRNSWQKGIWVDFERDIVLLDLLRQRRHDIHIPVRTMTTLWFFKIYARREVQKIRRFAIGGNWLCEKAIWGEFYKTLTQPGPNPNCIRAFKNLRELLVDDSFRIYKAKAVTREATMSTGERIGVNAIGEREVVKDKVQGWIGSLNDGKPIWQQVPEVKVVRWDEWHMDNMLALAT